MGCNLNIDTFYNRNLIINHCNEQFSVFYFLKRRPLLIVKLSGFKSV